MIQYPAWGGTSLGLLPTTSGAPLVSLPLTLRDYIGNVIDLSIASYIPTATFPIILQLTGLAGPTLGLSETFTQTSLATPPANNTFQLTSTSPNCTVNFTNDSAARVAFSNLIPGKYQLILSVTNISSGERFILRDMLVLTA